MAQIGGLGQDTFVEGEPGEFPIYEAGGGNRIEGLNLDCLDAAVHPALPLRSHATPDFSRSYRAETVVSCRCHTAIGRARPPARKSNDAFAAPAAPCQIELEGGRRGSPAAAEPAR